MAYPSVADFKDSLNSKPLPEVVRETLFQGDVYAFKDSPNTLIELRTHLVRALRLRSADDVAVVGSAKLGFSIAPDTFARAFSTESDIDVVVVDADLFDECWMSLIQWHYLRPNRMSGVERHWARARSDDIYWGWLTPDKIRYPGELGMPHALRGLTGLTTRWFDAFRSLSRYPALSTRDVNGRLYRTWEHATEYHVSGLRHLKQQLARTI